MKKIISVFLLFVLAVPSKGQVQNENIPGNGYYADNSFHSWQEDNTSANIIVANMEHYNAIVSNLQTLFNGSNDEIIYDDEDDNIIVNSASLALISKAYIIQQISVSDGDIAFFTYSKNVEGERIWLRNEIYVQFVDTSYFRLYAQPLFSDYGVTAYNYEGDNEFHLICNDETKMVMLANLLHQHFSTEYSTVDFYCDAALASINDTYFSDQWGLHNTGQNGGTVGVDIKATEAWEFIQNNVSNVNPNIKVAVIDDGVESHEDFYYSDWTNKVLSGYTANGDGNGSPLQGHFHGQCCAGIIGAVHNDIGVSGVAPNSLIIPIRICKKNINLHTGSFYMFSAANIAQAIEISWKNLGADVINCSWHHNKNEKISRAIQSACSKGRNGKGCIVVASAGNSVDGENGVEFPAQLGYVVAVGAIDENGSRADFSNHSSALNVMAPGVNIPTIDRNESLGYNPYYTYTLGNDYTNYKYTKYFDGTSAACAHASGIAALILSVNPNLTGQQVRDIIESTAQKVGGYNYQQNPNHPNGTWNLEMGYGLVDAYEAVKKAFADLYIKDTVNDNGSVPSAVYCAHNSPDIWTTDLNEVVCNPTGGEYCYVCVRVHNKSNFVSSGHEKLIVNWAKAGMGLPWSSGWLGGNYYAPGVPGSGYVTDVAGISIPSIPAGQDTIVRILWLAPDPADYASVLPVEGEDWWHFCLAARVHDGTPIVGENSQWLNMKAFTVNNDNVAWKNISIVSEGCRGAAVAVSNAYELPKDYNLTLFEAADDNGSLADDAEVYIVLDNGLLVALNGSGISGWTWVNSNTLRWTGGTANLPLTLPAGSNHILKVYVNFLVDQQSGQPQYDFDLVLSDPVDGILGGEHFRCIPPEGCGFDPVVSATPGVDIIDFHVVEEDEYALYEVTDMYGNSATFYTGDFTVFSAESGCYTVCVTTLDGCTECRTLCVTLPDAMLSSIYPNPADGEVNIDYQLSRRISGGTIQIISANGVKMYSQAVTNTTKGKTMKGSLKLSTAAFAPGQYIVRILSSKGEVYDSKTLIVK